MKREKRGGRKKRKEERREQRKRGEGKREGKREGKVKKEDLVVITIDTLKEKRKKRRK